MYVDLAAVFTTQATVKQESRAGAEKPRDAVVNFDMYSLALHIT